MKPGRVYIHKIIWIIYLGLDSYTSLQSTSFYRERLWQRRSFRLSGDFYYVRASQYWSSKTEIIGTIRSCQMGSLSEPGRSKAGGKLMHPRATLSIYHPRRGPPIFFTTSSGILGISVQLNPDEKFLLYPTLELGGGIFPNHGIA